MPRDAVRERARQRGDAATESLPHPSHGNCILIAGRSDCQYSIARIDAQLMAVPNDCFSTLPIQRPAPFMRDTILASQNFFHRPNLYFANRDFNYPYRNFRQPVRHPPRCATRHDPAATLLTLSTVATAV